MGIMVRELTIILVVLVHIGVYKMIVFEISNFVIVNWQKTIKSPNTKESYKRIVTSYINSLNSPANMFDMESVDKFVNSPTIKSMSTKRVTFYALKSFCRFAYPDKLATIEKVKLTSVDARPTTGTYIPKHVRNKAIWQLQSIEDNPDLSPYKRFLAKRNRIILGLLQLGLRVSEVTGLRWLHVSFIPQYIEVHGKGDKWRNVPMPNKLDSLLRETWEDLHREYPNEARNFFVVGGVDYKITRKAIRDVIQSYVGDYSPHDFRHTMITDLLESDMPIEQIKVITGHSRIETVALYDRSSEKRATNNFRSKLSISL